MARSTAIPLHRCCLASLLAGCCAPLAAAQSAAHPLTLSLGYNYAYSDQGNGFANLNGWYGSLDWEATQRFGISFSHESFWGGFQGGSVNQHEWLGGIEVALRRGEHTVNPFLQPLGGVTRSSAPGMLEEQPSFQLAAGADIKLKGKLSLEVIPAEYNLAHGSTGYLNTFQAAGGLMYTFSR